MFENRVKLLNNKKKKNGCVVYWMSRDQRVRDNWAFIAAAKMALEDNSLLAVVFNLTNEYIGANDRHFAFMIEGLKEVKQTLGELGIPFYLLRGRPEEEIPAFMSANGCGCLITDFSPLRLNRKWKNDVAERIDVSFVEVDAHNIVPCFFASNKREFAARTIRPKINRLLSDFLKEFPETPVVTGLNATAHDINSLQISDHGFPVVSGMTAAENMLKDFIDTRLDGYNINRNNPCLDAQSGLSPYLHFGQISAQRVALAVTASDAPDVDKSAFLEELIVRRELSDNFCLYEENYDNIECADRWARESIERHRDDVRDYVYEYDTYLNGETHDELWNAAQMELFLTGKMHGYMRMYWAKKILEWTRDVETAFEYAIKLNDTLALDGRDPNGYAGIAWSIAGVHDRAWFERPVFGKIRYMNYNGCKSKFDVNGYIQKIKEKRG